MNRNARSILLTVAGTVILAFGTAIFILPYELILGGVSGIAIILNHVIDVKFITVDLIVAVLSWAFFFLGLIVLGKNFALKTLLSTLVYPPAISLFTYIYEIPALHGFFDMKLGDGTELLLAALFGGAFIGAGCAVTFLGGGSTGGVDILSFSLCRIFKKLKSSVSIFIIDAVVIAAGLLVFQNLGLSLLGILSIFVSATLVDKIFLGSDKSYVAEIITGKYEQITDAVIKNLDRTTTVIDAVGGYSKKQTKIVIVTFKAAQYAALMNIINTVDPGTFMNVYRVHEINGEGWTR